MSLLNPFFDVTSKRLVISLSNSGLFQLPDPYQEDQWSITLAPCYRISTTQAPFFAPFNIANFALAVYVGTIGTTNTQQINWTKTDDYHFEGVLDFNTAEINALATGTQQIIEMRLSSATETYRLQQTVTYKKIVNPTGTLAVPVGDRALGAAEAAQIYVPYELPPGLGLTLVSPDGTKKNLLKTENDGSFNPEPL
jgi:hypothetical protein